MCLFSLSYFVFYEEKYNHSYCLLGCALQQSKYSRQLPSNDGLDHQAVNSSSCRRPSLISLVWTTIVCKIYLALLFSSLFCYSWWKAEYKQENRCMTCLRWYLVWLHRLCPAQNRRHLWHFPWCRWHSSDLWQGMMSIHGLCEYWRTCGCGCHCENVSVDRSCI